MWGDGKAASWIEVTEEEAGQRIDNYLFARLKGVPKSHVYRVLRSGEVRVNSGRVDASRRVQAGEDGRAVTRRFLGTGRAYEPADR